MRPVSILLSVTADASVLAITMVCSSTPGGPSPSTVTPVVARLPRAQRQPPPIQLRHSLPHRRGHPRRGRSILGTLEGLLRGERTHGYSNVANRMQCQTSRMTPVQPQSPPLLKLHDSTPWQPHCAHPINTDHGQTYTSKDIRPITVAPATTPAVAPTPTDLLCSVRSDFISSVHNQ